MKKRTITLAVVILLLSVVTAEGQSRRPAESNSGDPVELLLTMRRQLGLSWQQVSAMRAIQQQLDAANRPFVDRLVEIRREIQAEPVQVANDGRDRGRRPSEVHLASGRGLLNKIHENNLAAMEEVQTLLTAEQKRIARAVWQSQFRREGGRIRLPGG